MPVRGSNCVSQEDAHRRKEDILKKIHAAKEKEIALQQCYESSDDENDEDIRQNAIKVRLSVFMIYEISLHTLL